MKIKKIYAASLIICILLVLVVASSCFFSGNSKEGEIAQDTETAGEINGGTEGTSEEEFNKLLENEDFLEVFNSFYYPDSVVKEAKQVENDENLIYILLEVAEDSKNVGSYYKDKEIQSIWRRYAIFEERPEKVGEEFLESESENIPVFKFTYSSEEKDKVVNVLVKGLEENRTQIMIIYWNLQ